MSSIIFVPRFCTREGTSATTAHMIFSSKFVLNVVEQGVKTKTRKYLEMMEKEVKPWLDSLKMPYIFMQDGTQALTNKLTQLWCK